MNQFEQIRPYNNTEVGKVLNRLRDDKEFIATIAHYRFNKWPKFARHSIGRLVVKRYLEKYLEPITTVKAFQLKVKEFMDQMIDQTIDHLAVEGMENVPKTPCLFVSNHRDIAMDPALINWALYQAGHETVRIAIGDNLLSKPWTSDIMRLNKSFIVQRSIKAPRKLFAAFKTLSAYIQHSLKADKEHVWIAQREGRAKDGIDTTEPAIIKMFGIAKSKEQTLAEYINSLNIIPVSISYEYDPCDAAKAHELTEKVRRGHYEKSKHEDIQTIGRGISGQKGRVTVSFGQPLNNLKKDASAEEIAATIDRIILKNYAIRPSNIIALQQLQPELDIDPSEFGVSFNDIKTQAPIFNERFDAIEPSDEQAYLSAYAAPLQRRINEATR